MASLFKSVKSTFRSIQDISQKSFKFPLSPFCSTSVGNRFTAGLSPSVSDIRPDLSSDAFTSIDVRMMVPEPKVSCKTEDDGRLKWVFLGCPGVGKGTYASRLAKVLQIPHISMGDLVRAEVKRDTPVSKQLDATMKSGQLVQDDVIFELLRNRLDLGEEIGEGGFILDGFPRTTNQATVLDAITPLDLIVNLRLREDVLVSKCLGRRICKECGGNFNVADIYLPAANGVPEIVMPPLSPPAGCEGKMTTRADDNEAVVRNRLEIYARESKPVEEYYRGTSRLLDFDIAGGIPETWPRLLAALNVEDKVHMEMLKVA